MTCVSIYFFRYIYIIAATSDTNFGRLAKWLTMNSNFHIHLTVLGLMMTAFHGLSTIFLSSDQFFFDQGAKRMNIFNTENLTRKVDLCVLCTIIFSLFPLMQKEKMQTTFLVKISVLKINNDVCFSMSKATPRTQNSNLGYSNA